MNSNRHLRTGCLVTFAITLAVVVACAGPPTPTPAPTPAPTKTAAAPTKAAEPAKSVPAPTRATEPVKGSPVTVKVAIDPAGRSSDAGHFIAIEKGYFKEQNINLDPISIATGPEWMQLLATGEIDVGGGSVNVATFNAILRGIPVKMVADKGTALPGRSYFTLVVRKDLWDSGALRQIADLRGKTIATNGSRTGGPTVIEMELILAKGGLGLKDVNLVDLGFADMNPGLAGKSIDAAFQMEPLATAGIDQGLGARWIESGDIFPFHQLAIMAYGPKFLKEQTDVASRFMVAYLKGVRDYNDALVKKDKKVRDEVIQILIKRTSLKQPEQYDKVGFPGLNPDGYVNAESVAKDQDWLVAHGFLPRKLDISDIIDNQFAERAVQALGKYVK